MLGAFLEAITPSVDRDQLGVMERAIEDGAGGRHIAQKFAPLFDGPVGGRHGGSVFISAHNDFQKDFTAFSRKDFQPHVVDDQKIRLDVFLEQTTFSGLGLFVKQLTHEIKDGTVLSLACSKTGWRVHAWVLMDTRRKTSLSSSSQKISPVSTGHHVINRSIILNS